MSMPVSFRRIVALLAAMAVAGLAGVAPSQTAHAATTISVNTSVDIAPCPNGPGSPGFSLRCAINYENGVGGGDIIDFEITANAAVTLHLRSQLPTLTASNVTIDGYDTSNEGSTRNTNSLSAGDNALIRVTIDGDSIAGNDGLVVYGSNDIIEGLRLVGFVANASSLGGDAVVLASNPFGGPPSTGDVVEGNFIGNVDGTAVIPENAVGIAVLPQNQGALIGGTNAGAANVISGNTTDGVISQVTKNTTLKWNYIGTNPAGSSAEANGSGVVIAGDTGNDVAGTATAGNVISGNTGWGISVLPFVGASVTPTTGGEIQGNIVGPTADQSADLGNGSGGVLLEGNTNLLLGGTAAGVGNVISGNGGPGVYLTAVQGAANKGNLVQGNDIGITGAGNPMGNASDGVKADEAASADAVGTYGSTAGSNTIANNGGYGVDLGNSSSDSVHVSVDLNSMYSNNIGGINLNGQFQPFCTSGLAYIENTTPNDLTPCPLVLAATPEKVIGEACTGCTVEIYTAPSATDDEGKTLLGIVKAGACPPSGPCTNFSPWTLKHADYLTTLVRGDFITATSTIKTQPYYPLPTPAPTFYSQTSSFSRDVPVGRTLVVNTTQDLGPGCSLAALSLRCALIRAEADVQGDEIDFNIPSGQCSPACDMALASKPLPVLTAASTFINGWTQPGAMPNSHATLGPGDNAITRILLNGSALSGPANGLTFRSSYESVEGLAIGNFRGGDGVQIGGGTTGFAVFDIVAGCYVGSLNGLTPARNTNGVDLQNRSAFSTVGGRAVMDDNVIGGNTNYGVQSTGIGDNVLRENLIGMRAPDKAPLSNGYDGVLLFGTANDIIGGIRQTLVGTKLIADEGNVISASFNNGVEGLDAQQAAIVGNEIGVDGASDPGIKVGNGFAGVFLFLGANNLVGDLPFGIGGNVIAGNRADGVDLLADTGDLVAGNIVGLVQANGGYGVMAGASTFITGLPAQLRAHLTQGLLRKAIRHHATVGGETPIVSGVSTNVIAGNGMQGVLIGQSSTDSDVHVAVNTNSMFANGGLAGIKFFGGGLCYTPPGGVNDQLSCPSIGFSTIGAVNGSGCPGCDVEVYEATNVAANKGYGEGKLYLGSTTVAGNGTWSLGIGRLKVPAGTFVTATQSQFIPNSFQQFGSYYLETSQFSFDVALHQGSNRHRTQTRRGSPVPLHARFNWTTVSRLLFSRTPRAWPHYRVRYRPLKP